MRSFGEIMRDPKGLKASGAGVPHVDRGWPFEPAKMYSSPAGYVLAEGNHLRGAPGQLPDLESL